MADVKTLTRSVKPDATLAAAAQEALDALAETVGEDQLGEHLGVVAEGDRVVSHLFSTTHPGYVGWRWAVTVTRASRHRQVTVSDIVLLPGEESLVAPPWVPWRDRMAKEDLGPGDLVPVEDGDPRLVPGYLVGDEVLDKTSAREQREVVSEVGLGREQVLSVAGRDQAADRWYAGDNGPEASIAQAAPGRCGSCGFLVRMSGPLASAFGVCASDASPSDGQAVSFDHGCGAHSDVRPEPTPRQSTTPAHDTLTWDTFSDGEMEIVSR